MARTAPVPNIPAPPGMNPGAFVAGGGGDGGGAGGKGGKNGNGNEGANGGDGDENANGDGNNAGACGEGSTGSCANCAAEAQAGDPVSVLSGETFTVPKTDVFLKGFFNLQIDRTYTLSARGRDIGLGWGWSHTLAWEIVRTRRSLWVRDGRGRQQEFPDITEPGKESASGGWALMSLSDGGFVLRPGNEFFHYFEPDPLVRDRYRLKAVAFRNRGAIRLEYDGARLARIIDTADRVVVVAGDRDGHITSFSVREPGGGTLVFARYRYDRGGQLVEATDADGHTWRFAYDDDRRLVRMTLPTGLTFHYAYDRAGRCVETFGASPGDDYGLDTRAGTTLADGSPAKGILHARLDFIDDDSVEVADSLRIQRYLAGEQGKVARTVDGAGGVTTRVFDELSNEVEHEDASGAVTKRTYDGMGNIVSEVDAEGREVRLTRDFEGRTIEVVDPAGNRTESIRDRWGDVICVRYQGGGVATYEYDGRGKLIAQSDPDGARTTYEWDAFGNLVKRTLPNGSSISYSYDYWGRCLAETTPTSAFKFWYSFSGRIVQVQDALGRVKTYAFDPLGNITRVTTPDGLGRVYGRNGLGWLTSITYENGDRVELRYDREGNLLAGQNENGDWHVIQRDVTGRTVQEHHFNGHVRSFTNDAMGRPLRADEGEYGIVELERNAVGQITLQSGADDLQISYDYDARGFLAAAHVGEISTEFERDEAGNVLLERQIVGDQRYEVRTPRTPAGRVSGLATTLGLSVGLRRDALGYLAELRESEQLVVSIQRDAMGAVSRTELPGGAVIADERDAARRLVRRSVAVPDVQGSTREPEWVGQVDTGVSKRYVYSAVDEVLTESTDRDHVEFEYDARHRLRKLSGSRGEETWTSDGIGNYFAIGDGVSSSQYAPGGRVIERGATEYVWDDAGFLLEKVRRTDDAGEERWRYEWSSRGTLTAIQLPDGARLEFDYDAFGRRVRKRLLTQSGADGGAVLASDTHYVWSQDQLTHVVTSQGEGEPSVRSFVYDDDQFTPIAQRQNAGDWEYYVANHVGTPEELIDARGQLLGRLSRDTFGATRASGQSTPMRAPGQFEDQETGLHYNRHRYYDPEVGHYLSPDPLGPIGGTNLYGFGPNPISWYDPLGLQHMMLAQVWDANGNEILPFTQYNSGQTPYSQSQGWNNQDPRNDTERQFLRDLTTAQQNGANLNGAQATCLGQFPPCRNCHRAMRDFADRNGTTITYNWNGPPPDHAPQSITYHGGNPTTGARGALPTGVGTGAQALVGAGTPGNEGAYAMTPTTGAPSNTGGAYRYNDWGGAGTAYGNQRDAIQTGPY